jgi:replicative DNA helicase
VRWCLEKVESLRPPEVKRLSEVVEHLRDEPEAGLPCELPGLTEKLGGWRPGELTIHGGEAACGKTTATCQEVVGLLSNSHFGRKSRYGMIVDFWVGYS